MIAEMKKTRNYYTTSVRKPGRKRQFGRPRRRYEDNIRMGLPEILCKDMDYVHLAQGQVRMAGYCEHGVFRLQLKDY
jgi:hypothetical protein